MTYRPMPTRENYNRCLGASRKHPDTGQEDIVVYVSFQDEAGERFSVSVGKMLEDYKRFSKDMGGKEIYEFHEGINSALVASGNLERVSHGRDFMTRAYTVIEEGFPATKFGL